MYIIYIYIFIYVFVYINQLLCNITSISNCNIYIYIIMVALGPWIKTLLRSSAVRSAQLFVGSHQVLTRRAQGAAGRRGTARLVANIEQKRGSKSG